MTAFPFVEAHCAAEAVTFDPALLKSPLWTESSFFLFFPFLLSGGRPFRHLSCEAGIHFSWFNAGQPLRCRLSFGSIVAAMLDLPISPPIGRFPSPVKHKRAMLLH